MEWINYYWYGIDTTINEKVIEEDDKSQNVKSDPFIEELKDKLSKPNKGLKAVDISYI